MAYYFNKNFYLYINFLKIIKFKNLYLNLILLVFLNIYFIFLLLFVFKKY